MRRPIISCGDRLRDEYIEYFETKFPERGKVLRVPDLMDRREGVLNRRKKIFFLYLIGLLLLIFLITQPLNVVPPFPAETLRVLALVTAMFCIFGLYALRPRTWDMLPMTYENGISDLFHPYIGFSEITEIFYGYSDGHPVDTKKARYILLFSKKRPLKDCPTIIESRFIDDYFDFLVETIKEKRPDVPWYRYDLGELKGNNWYSMIEKEKNSRRSPGGPDSKWEKYRDAKLEEVRERLKKERQKEVSG